MSPELKEKRNKLIKALAAAFPGATGALSPTGIQVSLTIPWEDTMPSLSRKINEIVPPILPAGFHLAVWEEQTATASFKALITIR